MNRSYPRRREARRVLPYPLFKRLFGDRRKWGALPPAGDADWAAWQQLYTQFYAANQRQSIGRTVNHAGYRVVREVDFTGKSVLEVGAGDLAHCEYWCGRPAHYAVLDANQGMLDMAIARMKALEIDSDVRLVSHADSAIIPYADDTFDIFCTFYVLEHVYPLEPFLNEIRRIVKPGGLIVGGIPCEGGLAWGAGRYLTSRRWLERNSSLKMEKIVCWEHPNLAGDILAALETTFQRSRIRMWPLGGPFIDLNLIATFIMTNAK